MLQRQTPSKPKGKVKGCTNIHQQIPLHNRRQFVPYTVEFNFSTVTDLLQPIISQLATDCIFWRRIYTRVSTHPNTHHYYSYCHVIYSSLSWIQIPPFLFFFPSLLPHFFFSTCTFDNKPHLHEHTQIPL